MLAVANRQRGFVDTDVDAVIRLVAVLGFLEEGVGADVYTWLIEYKGAIISVGMVLAIIDLFFTKPAAIIAAPSRGAADDDDTQCNDGRRPAGPRGRDQRGASASRSTPPTSAWTSA